MFGTDIKSNAIHGSSNVDHAASNIKLVFGELEFNTDGTVQGSVSAVLLCIHMIHVVVGTITLHPSVLARI